jgi:DNA-binding NtrC family response regulator
MQNSSILLIDDEQTILTAMRDILIMEGYKRVHCISDSRQAADNLKKYKIDVILLDLMMPHMSGEEILTMVSKDFPWIPVIVVTGANDVKTAVECMKLGAFDFLVKTVDPDKLLSSIRNALKIKALQEENQRLRDNLLHPSTAFDNEFKNIITQNEKMLTIFSYVKSIAASDQPVLITGETGTGKDLLAQAVHRLSGRDGMYIPVNISGLDDTVFSDTLFGHRKGSFTGATGSRSGLAVKAGDGTLFLDEIGELPPASQVKLLRFIENNEFFPIGADAPVKSNARIIAATNKDLSREMEKGNFRNDLFFRLNMHTVNLPPLRERKDDIPLLTGHFIDTVCEKLGRKKPYIPPELFHLLNSYSFPGNVRELQSMVTEAVGLHTKGILSLDVFKKRIETIHNKHAVKIPPRTFSFPTPLPSFETMKDLLMDEALKRAGGNQALAARLLGITPQAISRRLKKKNKKG